MKAAKDYIIFPLDVASMDEAGRYVDLLADYVGLFKVGLELFIRCGPRVVQLIRSAGAAGVFLDLKLHDIPATVHRAMAGIAELGVRFATIHCGETSKMLEAAVAAGRGRVKILAVTVLTSLSGDDLRAAGYRPDFCAHVTDLVLERARMAQHAGCAGVVCSPLEAARIKESLGSGFITVTPGIRPLWAADETDDQQRIATPAGAVKNGSDYLVIGRPIRDAADPQAAARRVAQEIAAQINKA